MEARSATLNGEQQLTDAGLNERLSPSSTYRLQLHAGFTARDVTEIIEYLHDLGVGSIYVSPILKARVGSTHGYDIVEHELLNPEIGTPEDFERLAAALRGANMGMVLDVVPNHVCIADQTNWRWYDVLENGPSSPQARFFDIDWEPPRIDLADKVLIPVLGDQYGRILESQELTIEFRDGGFIVRYWEKEFPLAPRSWPGVLTRVLEEMRVESGETDPGVLELESIITAINYLPLRTETDEARLRERQREKGIIRARLGRLAQECPGCLAVIERSLKRINGVKGRPETFDDLERLLADQAYRLSYWRVAADEINYRRFFDVNELAAIRVEDPAVFAAVHQSALNCIRSGWVTGLRIDHPDGLYDPVQYFERLQRACGAAATGVNEEDVSPHHRPFFIVAEKVIVGDEKPRRNWAVHGTTGYGFLNELNALYVDPAAESAFRELYRRFSGVEASFDDLIYRCKRLILRVSMSSELNVLARRLDRICQQHRHTRDFTLESLRFALSELIACFPVYRTYIREIETQVDEEDQRHIRIAMAEAKRRNPAISTSIFDAIAAILLLQDPEGITEEQRAARRLFVMRFQQLTGPVMAKGVEDTAFYRYYPLASLNEVGGDPLRFGLAPEAFHESIAARARDWPLNMLATSTHDTKRSEDVRSRVNALSEIPEEWAQAVERWRGMNRRHKVSPSAPDGNTEYLLYQTLVGTLPFEGLGGAAPGESFVARVQAYIEKASREAKIHTSWINPATEYEQAVRQFVSRVLQPAPQNEFLADFQKFAQPVAYAGIFNSLSQTLLKLTCPGVPDIYQGNEWLDFSLVDPDNRRPVDFALRRRLLASLSDSDCPQGLIAEMLERPEDGRLKLFLIRTILRCRRADPHFFAQAAYVPMAAFGDQTDHIVSFARIGQRRSMIAVATRFFLKLGLRLQPAIGQSVWLDSAVVAPEAASASAYRNILSGRTVRTARYRGKLLLP
jgi:(1->4)-alpha-D-glucan 1-alpha-D-glucosylmutase